MSPTAIIPAAAVVPPDQVLCINAVAELEQVARIMSTRGDRYREKQNA